MKKRCLKCTCLVAMLPLSTFAADIKWNGFLSVVGGKTLSADTQYQAGFLGYQGIYEDKLRYRPDSLLGLQAQAILSDKVRGSVQLVGRGGNNFDMQAEWAYLSYSLTEDLTFNFGRYRAPLFFYSDFIDVGYAYYWIRPPQETYAGPTSLEGFNIYYSKYFGDFEVSAQAYSGSTVIPATDASPLDVDTTLQGLVGAIGGEWWKLRLTLAESDYEINNPPPGVAATGEFEYLGVAFNVNQGNLQFLSEYSYREVPGDESTTWYTSLGYRIGNVTPHITYLDDEELLAAGNIDASAVTVGMAWNLQPGTVFKIEYLEKTPDDEVLEEIQLFTFGFDMVF